jgi:putative membrane protein
MMGYGFGGVWMWLFGLLVLLGVALLVVVAVRAFGGGISGPASPDDARDTTPPRQSRAREILDERYARGELTTEEYRERLQALDEK